MFDPSDVDAAMQLSYIATRLAKLALEAVAHDQQGLRMGRDESINISVAAREILEITEGSPPEALYRVNRR